MLFEVGMGWVGPWWFVWQMGILDEGASHSGWISLGAVLQASEFWRCYIGPVTALCWRKSIWLWVCVLSTTDWCKPVHSLCLCFREGPSCSAETVDDPEDGAHSCCGGSQDRLSASQWTQFPIGYQSALDRQHICAGLPEKRESQILYICSQPCYGNSWTVWELSVALCAFPVKSSGLCFTWTRCGIPSQQQSVG